MILRALLAGALGAALAACGGSGPAGVPDDERFGHRHEGRAPDGRETVLLTLPDTTGAFHTYPAVLDSVHVRPAANPVPADSSVRVEVLIKGVLPDACTTLDAAEQERAGNLLAVTLTMRQPRGALCAQVVRPFRFYLPLVGLYGPGAYTLTINGAVHPFTIRTAAPRR